jgi:hypothetical protein
MSEERAPLRQAKRPRAHGVRGDGVAVLLHHLARHGTEEVVRGEVLDEARARLLRG